MISFIWIVLAAVALYVVFNKLKLADKPAKFGMAGFCCSIIGLCSYLSVDSAMISMSGFVHIGGFVSILTVLGGMALTAYGVHLGGRSRWLYAGVMFSQLSVICTLRAALEVLLLLSSISEDWPYIITALLLVAYVGFFMYPVLRAADRVTILKFVAAYLIPLALLGTWAWLEPDGWETAILTIVGVAVLIPVFKFLWDIFSVFRKSEGGLWMALAVTLLPAIIAAATAFFVAIWIFVAIASVVLLVVLFMLFTGQGIPKPTWTKVRRSDGTTEDIEKEGRGPTGETYYRGKDSGQQYIDP